MKKIFLLLALGSLFLVAYKSSAQETDIRLAEKRPDPAEILVPFSETQYAVTSPPGTRNPFIEAMVNAISSDSLKSTLSELQAWGSRFLMNDNNKEIARSLMNRFLAFGYTNVALDSFYLAIPNWNGLHDSAWQYNVVCTVTGRSAPGEIYLVGGHWDSYSTIDPFHDAPGANDNGTAVAATLEIARVMKLFNYQPEATIRFVLFAAEELGLFGSRYAAASDRFYGNDVRYFLNLDMISNNPGNVPLVKVYQYLGWEWAALVAAEATEKYTDLDAVIPANNVNTGSDSFPYWLEGFPAAYFEEYNFSPNWHLPSDTVGNCNLPYLRKVTGGALATVAEQQRLPHPRELRAHSSPAAIRLNWLPTANASVRGYNIYRSDSSGTGFMKINGEPVSDSVYLDVPPLQNRPYSYSITTVNDSLEESGFSNEVAGALFNFCDTLLVIANCKGTKTTPDSVRAFYESVLDTIPHRWFEANAANRPDLTVLSRYRTIFWMSNTLETEANTSETFQGVAGFLENGGDLLFAGFNPGRFWISSTIPYPLAVPENLFFHSCFRVDSIDKKVQSMLCAATPATSGYPLLRVDSAKCMDKNFPGQIFNIEVYEPDGEANVIYRFDSRFDSSTSYGKMKHRPVGIEYEGTQHHSILLSFPLWYLDTADARTVMQYILKERFAHPSGVTGSPAVPRIAMNVFPDPVTRDYAVTVHLAGEGNLRLSLVSLSGTTMLLSERWAGKGSRTYRFSAATLSPGIYQVVAQQGNRVGCRKFIRVN